MMEHFDLVLKAYQELIASDDIHPTNDMDEVETQKSLITRRGAYYINQVDPRYGLLSKTSGNNKMGLSVDIILNKNGQFWDVATDVMVNDGRAARPVETATKTDTTLIPRWVQPTAELAGITSTPSTIPTQQPSIQELMDLISQLQNQISHLGDLVQANGISVDGLTRVVSNMQFPVYEGKGPFGIVFVLKPRGK